MVCTAPEAPSAATGKPSWDLPPAYWNDPAFGRRPIVFVEHADATAYCARLGGRLPTSAVDSLPDGRGVYGHFNVIGNATEWVADWARIPVWPRDGALVDPRNDVPSEYGHAARSHFQPAWTVCQFSP